MNRVKAGGEHSDEITFGVSHTLRAGSVFDRGVDLLVIKRSLKDIVSEMSAMQFVQFAELVLLIVIAWKVW